MGICDIISFLLPFEIKIPATKLAIEHIACNSDPYNKVNPSSNMKVFLTPRVRVLQQELLKYSWTVSQSENYNHA